MNDDNGTPPAVLVVGALHVDETATPLAPLIPGASNPVSWQRSLGGVACNVARVAQASAAVTLLACVGDDSAAVATALTATGVEARLLTRPGRQTGRYQAVLDTDGSLFVGLADVALAETLRADDIMDAMQQHQPDALILDANLQAACLRDTLAALPPDPSRRPVVIALAVSPHKVVRWQTLEQQVDLLICNRAEAAALGGLASGADAPAHLDALARLGFSRCIMTDGASPVATREPGTDVTLIDPPPVATVQTVNGAGDALAGATIPAWLAGHSLADSVRHAGLAAAVAVLEARQVAPSVT